MQRAVVALALLASGLLLLGGLLADVESGLQEAAQEAQEYWYERAEPQGLEEIDPPPDAELQGGQLQHLALDSELEVQLPEGTHVDDDTLELAGPTTITLSAGTQVNDLDVRLPAGTKITLTDSSGLQGKTLELGNDATITFPNGARLQLPDGGRLTETGMDRTKLRAAIANQHVTLEQDARLVTPLAEIQRDWHIMLGEGTRFELPPEDTDFPPNRLSTDDSSSTSRPARYTLPTGSQIQQGDYSASGPDLQSGSGHAAAGTGPTHSAATDPDNEDDSSRDEASTALDGLGAPPAWTWFLLAATLVTLSGLIGVRRMRHRMKNHGPRAAATYQIDQRAAGLPLGLAPRQSATLHVKIQKPGAHGDWYDQEAHIKARVGGHLIHNGPVGDHGVAIPLPGLEAGDHALEVRVRRGGLLRPHRLETFVRVAPWPEQIARDYQTLVDTLTRHHWVAEGATPRQVRRFLSDHVPGFTEHTADRLIGAFEEANYSPRTIDQADWTAFATTTRACLEAIHTMSEQAPARRRRPMDTAAAMNRHRISG